MTKEGRESMLIKPVSKDDLVTTTSVVYMSLNIVDRASDILRKKLDMISEMKACAVSAVESGDSIPFGEWLDRYIDPIGNVIDDIDCELYEAMEKEAEWFEKHMLIEDQE